MKRKSFLILCLSFFAFCGGYAQEQEGNEYERKLIRLVRDQNSRQDEQMLDEVLRQYYDSGLYPQDDLQYHYNELQGMDNWGICITNNVCNLIGMLILQRVLNVHRDKILYHPGFAQDSLYMRRMCERMEIPMPAEEDLRGESIASSFFVDWISRHTKRPVYLPASEIGTYYHDMPDSIKARLYNEGLTMHYSARPYDNLKVKCRNLEERYLLDYLQMSFRPYDLRKDTRRYYSPTPIETGGYYSVLFKDMLPFYRQHHPERLEWLKRMLQASETYKQRAQMQNTVMQRQANNHQATQ